MYAIYNLVMFIVSASADIFHLHCCACEQKLCYNRKCDLSEILLLFHIFTVMEILFGWKLPFISRRYMLFITLFCSCLHRSPHWILCIWNEMFCLWTVVMLQQEVWSERKKCLLLWWNLMIVDHIYLNCFSYCVFLAFSFSPKSHKNQISPQY